MGVENGSDEDKKIVQFPTAAERVLSMSQQSERKALKLLRSLRSTISKMRKESEEVGVDESFLKELHTYLTLAALLEQAYNHVIIERSRYLRDPQGEQVLENFIKSVQSLEKVIEKTISQVGDSGEGS